MYYITLTPIGLFASDESGNIKSSIYFSKDPKVASSQYLESKKPSISKEEKSILDSLKSKDITFEIKKDAYPHEFPNPAGEKVRSSMAALAQKNSFGAPELNQFIYQFSFELTKETMKSQPTEDKLINQAVSAIDDIDRIINQLSMRLREWYGIYYPELEEKLKDNEKFARYVDETLFRTDDLGLKPEESIGSEIKKSDLEEERRFAKTILLLFEQRKDLEKYIDLRCKETIPNITEIVGAESASRLLSHAGSLEKLAKFPSSTIQILGAEKALFRYLHNVGTSPKHGLIFNTGFIQRTPKEKRGKVARILASKLSIASKLDYYKGEFMGKKLKDEMEQALADAMKEKPKSSKPKKPLSKGSRPDFRDRKEKKPFSSEKPSGFRDRDEPNSFPPKKSSGFKGRREDRPFRSRDDSSSASRGRESASTEGIDFRDRNDHSSFPGKKPSGFKGKSEDRPFKSQAAPSSAPPVRESATPKGRGFQKYMDKFKSTPKKKKYQSRR